jgi:hypothetical protein
VSRNRVHGENQRPGIQVETKGETTHHDIRVEDNVVLDFNRAGIIIGPGPAPDLLESPVVTGNSVDRAGEIPANLIGIQLTGLAGQWHGAIVEDNTIGAAIPVKIKGPVPDEPPPTCASGSPSLGLSPRLILKRHTGLGYAKVPAQHGLMLVVETTSHRSERHCAGEA